MEKLAVHVQVPQPSAQSVFLAAPVVGPVQLEHPVSGHHVGQP